MRESESSFFKRKTDIVFFKRTKSYKIPIRLQKKLEIVVGTKTS